MIRKGFKFRLEPCNAQRADMVRFAGHNRAVWNKALRITRDRLDRGIPILWFHELNWNMVKLWKPSDEMNWLKEAPSQTLIQTLKHFDQAMRDCFDKKQPNKRMPRFKKKGCRDSFLFPQGFEVAGNRIKLPKLGWMKFRKSRELVGKMKSATVSRNGAHWFVSILCEMEVEDVAHPSTSAIGIDMGVREFAATSNGIFIDPVNAYRKHEKKLAIIQGGMSRKRKFGSNWKRGKQRLRRLHGKIADIRLDHLHKTSTSICKNHAVIVVEDLLIREMTASAKGTKANPGTLVKVTSLFNKAILDQGWFEFRRQLEYKQEWLHGEVIAVSPEGTSTTCPECGVDDALNRPNLRKWFACVSCGHREHSGTVAAKNLLKRAGYARLACEVSGASMPPAAGTLQSTCVVQ